jgi:hypothetical protein
MEDPLARPGEIVKRLCGTTAEEMGQWARWKRQ